MTDQCALPGRCWSALDTADGCPARRASSRRHGVDTGDWFRVPGTAIPEPTSDNPIAYIGAPAALMRASRWHRSQSCRVLSTHRAAFELPRRQCGHHNTEQLRGKRLGARVEGAAMWIHTVIALEKLGLRPERDQISIAEIGDPLDIVEALEAGRIAGAVLPRPQCEQLANNGYSILFDLHPANGIWRTGCLGCDN